MHLRIKVIFFIQNRCKYWKYTTHYLQNCHNGKMTDKEELGVALLHAVNISWLVDVVKSPLLNRPDAVSLTI